MTFTFLADTDEGRSGIMFVHTKCVLQLVYSSHTGGFFLSSHRAVKNSCNGDGGHGKGAIAVAMIAGRTSMILLGDLHIMTDRG